MIGYSIGPVVILYVVSLLGIGATAWLMVPGVLLGVLMWFLMPDDERFSAKSSEEDPLGHGYRKLFDAAFFLGPVGLLAVSRIMGSLSLVTFTSAVPLWLVVDREVDPDAPLVGWTLAALALSAGISGVIRSWDRAWTGMRLSRAAWCWRWHRYSRCFFEAGSLAYVVTVALAGGLVYASLPHMILSARTSRHTRWVRHLGCLSWASSRV